MNKPSNLQIPNNYKMILPDVNILNVNMLTSHIFQLKTV